MLPEDLHRLSLEETLIIAEKCEKPFLSSLQEMDIGNTLEQTLVDTYIPLAAALSHDTRAAGSTPVIGINGAQGAGKSTFCKLLKVVLKAGFSKDVAVLSIDDLYLTSAARRALAHDVHPLLATRGVPGTHDVKLGLSLLSKFKELAKGQSVEVPVFDKAQDDRQPQSQSRRVIGPVDLILFEGWCVGANPQSEEALSAPVNDLERDEDPDQIWRRYVNDQLHMEYQKLFNQLDILIMLKVPDMASVMKWRSTQEGKLAKNTNLSNHRIMDTAELQRFIMHYERLTRHMLTEMPERADIVYDLNDEHLFERVRVNPD